MIQKDDFITLILLILLLSASQFILSCGSTVHEEALSSIELPQNNQGIITFTTGDVKKLQNNEWSDAEINDFLEKGDTVKVETDSFCEIQFGSRAVVKIEENTELLIPSLNTGNDKTDINLKMITGSVLSKVNKLASSDSFTVQTKSAACGIRGTEFMVKSEKGADTLLAVKEGSVIIVPSKIDIDKLMSIISTDNTEIIRAIENIEESFIVVSADEETLLNEKNIFEIEKIYVDLEKAAAVFSSNGMNETEASVKIKSLSEKLVNKLVQTAPLTAEHKEEMKDLDSMIIREIPEADEGKNKSDDLVKVFVSVDISDALITREDRVLGKGEFSAIYNNGENISLTIRKKGYFDKTLDFTAVKENENRYKVTLEKDPDAKKTVSVSIKAIPEDAEIIIDSVSEGSGSVIKEMSAEKTYNVLVKKEGFQKKHFSIVNPDKNETFDVELLPSIERRIKVSNGFLTGSIVFSNNNIFTADSYGEVSASDTEGRILWKQQTGNTPNERAFPVAYRRNLYFSGANEFVTTDISYGSVKNSVFLDDDQSHVFGRRVVVIGNTGIFPANRSLLKFNLETGDFTAEIPIPGGTRMTPGIYGNELLIVNQKGIFYRIDSVSGKTISSVQTEVQQPVVNNVAVKTDYAYFNGRKGKIVCLNLLDNSIVWTRSLTEGKALMITGDLQCGEKGVYAFSGSRIYAVSAETGENLFSPVPGVSCPPVLAGDVLYYGTAGGNFVSADAASGEILETINISSRITASPVYVDGKIYAGTDNGEILIINP